jgi:hypothetical protein
VASTTAIKERRAETEVDTALLGVLLPLLLPLAPGDAVGEGVAAWMLEVAAARAGAREALAV